MVRKKSYKYVPTPLPDLTPGEATALEKKLRGEIDSWARLQGDHAKKTNFRGLFGALLPPRKHHP